MGLPVSLVHVRRLHESQASLLSLLPLSGVTLEISFEIVPHSTRGGTHSSAPCCCACWSCGWIDLRSTVGKHKRLFTFKSSTCGFCFGFRELPTYLLCVNLSFYRTGISVYWSPPTGCEVFPAEFHISRCRLDLGLPGRSCLVRLFHIGWCKRVHSMLEMRGWLVCRFKANETVKFLFQTDEWGCLCLYPTLVL